MNKVFQAFCILFFTILTSNISLGQIKSDFSSKKKKENSFRSFLLSFDYFTNTFISGSYNQIVKQPLYTPSLSFLNNNYDITFSLNAIENSDKSLSGTTYEYDFSFGYTINFNEKLNLYPAITHMEYGNNTHPLQTLTSDIFQLNLNYNIKNYSFILSSNYLLGKENTFYFSLLNSINIYFENFPFKNTWLSVHPELDLNVSDKNAYNYQILNNYTFLDIADFYRNDFNSATLSLRFLRWLEQNQDATLDKVRDYFIDDINQYKPYLLEHSYTVPNIGMVIPFYYTFGNFSLNLISYILIPTDQSELYEQNTDIYFNAGISYMLEF